MIKLYLYEFSNHLEFNNLYNRVPEALKNNIKNFKNLDSQKQSLLAWVLLGLALKDEYNLDLLNLEIKYHENGKPFFANSDIHFSISHSNNLVGIAISKQAIGLDLEFFDSNKNYLKLSQRILSNEESLQLLKESQKESYILTNWVIKEAYLKMTGEGIKPSTFKTKPIKKYFKIFKFNKEEYYLALYYLLKEAISVKILTSL